MITEPESVVALKWKGVRAPPARWVPVIERLINLCKVNRVIIITYEVGHDPANTSLEVYDCLQTPA